MMVGRYNSRYDGPPTPDVILYDYTTEESPVIIGVTHTKGAKADLKKVIDLIDDDLYGIQEGFVYTYKTQQWFRFGDGGLPTKSSFPGVLKLDFHV